MTAQREFYLDPASIPDATITDKIIEAERPFIDARRAKNRGQGDRTQAPLTGLALSGGGIRSASVCLGGLQALHRKVGIAGVDYLSTVSGGGYIGSSLTAGLHQSGGKFPFAYDRDYCDTDAVRHIRDFSRYLVPDGLSDVIVSATIFLRGLAANMVVLAPVLLLAVWLTLLSHPQYEYLRTPRVMWRDAWEILPSWAPGGVDPLWVSTGFYVTQNLLLIFAAATLLWAFTKSFWTSSLWLGFKEQPIWIKGIDPVWQAARRGAARFFSRISFGFIKTDDGDEGTKNAGDRSDELRGWFPAILQLVLILAAISAAFELQPFILEQMKGSGHVEGADPGLGQGTTFVDQLFAGIYDFIAHSKLPAAVGAVVAFFSKYLIDIEKFANRSSSKWVRILKIFPAAAWWFIGLIIPAFLWFVYLEVCQLAYTREPSKLLGGRLAPLLDFVADDKNRHAFGGALGFVAPTPMTGLIFLGFAVAFVLALAINPNATSLFRLYRDRLNKAFVFDPDTKNRDSRKNLRGLDLPLHAIDTDLCPYPLINTSLNLEGSQFANKRGRNADFFVFSKAYCGSLATGYVDSAGLHRDERDLNLATAMAISGAAVSANMGASTVKPLVATLALLNVRLGYWITNPKEVSRDISKTKRVLGHLLEGAKRSFLLFAEVFSRIDETSSSIYLTDGGNLENLGIYELLRRRCKVIVAIDAEADSGMDFPSLVTLERFARTDLGVIIDLPWEDIRRRALEVNAAFEAAARDPSVQIEKKPGPHCAICNIVYSADPADDGLLFYFKSSLSGDEKDVIFDYKRKYREFPHETTVDQFFGEQQLEAYRELGYHMVSEMLDPALPGRIRKGDADVPDFAIKTRRSDKDKDVKELKAAIVDRLHAALRGAPVPAPAQTAPKP